MTAAPDILVRRGLDRGLVGTTLASAAIHAALVALLLTVPGRLLAPSPKMESYTVDLVAPDVLGGTNLVQGGGKAKEPAARAESPPAVEPQAAVAAPAAKPVAEPAVLPESPPKPLAPEPAKPAPESVEAMPPPKPPEPPAPVHEVPKPAAPPPEPKPAPPPKPAPIADAKPAEPKPVAKPAEPPKPVAKVQEQLKPAPPAARPAVAEKAAQAAPHEKPAESAKETAAERAAAKRDAEIAAAVQRRAASVQGGAGASGKELDQQIAAAVQRRAQQVGAGSGAPAAGGLASVGPGTGVGGTPAGLDYILYQGRMNQRIKAAWAWAGTDKSLNAVIQFDLTPEGEIRNVRTVHSSGDAKYDASCERAVRAVNPLEPVPEKYRKEFSSVEMTFNANDREP